MSNLDIIRAWKDEQYRNGLSSEEKALLPENPAGVLDLSDADLEEVEGGSTSWIISGIVGASIAITLNLCGSIKSGGSCSQGTYGCC